MFKYTLFLREKGSGTREILEQHLRHIGHDLSEFSTVHRVNDQAVILGFIKEGCGISFMYESSVVHYIKEGVLKQINIPGFHAWHELNFIWRQPGIFETDYVRILKEMLSGQEI